MFHHMLRKNTQTLNCDKLSSLNGWREVKEEGENEEAVEIWWEICRAPATASDLGPMKTFVTGPTTTSHANPVLLL